MGFYGKIYEQAVNIFRCLKFKNNNSEDFPSRTLASEISLQADGGEACATLSAGNKWIQFESNDDNLNCKIYHAKSSQDAGTTEIFTSTPNEGVDPSVDSINFGAIITVQYPKTDAAGHIIEYEVKKYQLQSDISALQQTLNEHAILLEGLTTPIKDTIKLLDEADKGLDKKIDDSLIAIEGAVTGSADSATRAEDRAQAAADSANAAATSAQNAVEATNNMKNVIGEWPDNGSSIASTIGNWTDANTITTKINSLAAQIDQIWSRLG